LQCEVRVGGFGGAHGLERYLKDADIGLIVDATHPYAAQISRNAVCAAAAAGIPCWRLSRPAWRPKAEDKWLTVDGWDALRAGIEPFERPLFTLGREPLEHLDDIPDHQYWTVRLLDPQPPHPRAAFIATRGPFELDDERALFVERGFDIVVSKNSGGDATQAKLCAARELGLPVLMLERPELPDADWHFEDRNELREALIRHSIW
jgi:precorrin-6A/cobalt-precorrin-6A reductase